jgi:hypothetical protein
MVSYDEKVGEKGLLNPQQAHAFPMILIEGAIGQC